MAAAFKGIKRHYVVTMKSPLGAKASFWAHRPERSNMLMLRIMTKISLTLGRSAGRVVLYGIALYFFLFAPASRRASKDYLGRVLGRQPHWRDGFRHVFSFASTIHDRIYVLNDRFDLFAIRVHGQEIIDAALAANRGALLMGAHLGSFEMLRAVARHHNDIRASMAMYEQNAQKLNAMLAAISPLAGQDIIPLGQIDSMLRIGERLEEGGVVGILADRSLDHGQTRPIMFFGRLAYWPVAPFRMAAVVRRRLIFMTGLYGLGNRYDIHFEALADFTDIGPADREAAIDRAMHRYVAMLERYCRAAPYNWFNFFDFWEAPAAPAK